MKKDVKEKWVAALRSGEYKQVDGYLKGELGGDEENAGKIGYCCLGVLCEIYQRETGQGKWEPITNIFSDEEHAYEFGFDGAKGFLPTSVAEWAGLEAVEFLKSKELTDDRFEYDPKIRNDEHGPTNADKPLTLSKLNDDGYTFEEIAEVIEAQL